MSLLKWVWPLRQSFQKLLLKLRTVLLLAPPPRNCLQNQLSARKENPRRRKYQRKDGSPSSPSAEVAPLAPRTSPRSWRCLQSNLSP